MERLKAFGHIRQWGVSNLNADDMDEFIAAGGEGCATDQILYNLVRRGPEHTLLPWLERHRVPTMAYSRVEQGELLRNAALGTIVARLEATPAQVALAWVMRRDGIIAILKAGTVEHVLENRRAADIALSASNLSAPDASFPTPGRSATQDAVAPAA